MCDVKMVVMWFEGISFCDNLEDIVKYIGNTATQDYIVQKYIGTYNLHHCLFSVGF